MTPADEMDSFEDALDALMTGLGEAKTVTASFDGELARMRRTLSETHRDLGTLERGISRGLRGAFDGLVFDGLKLSDALTKVATSMVDAAYAAAVNPVARHFGGIIASGLDSVIHALAPFGDGAGFAQGRVMPFARGGVVSQATVFPMRGGTGLMGEAGPEAILPLARGADGRLGVRSEARARPVQVTINVATPDVAGFRRSQTQIAAQMGRMLAQGERNR